MEERIPVAIRIDKGPLIKRDAGWSCHEGAFIYDAQLARQLLHGLPHGQRVAIQVGNERGNFTPTGSRRAIDDFRRRAGLQPSNMLTLLRP